MAHDPGLSGPASSRGSADSTGITTRGSTVTEHDERGVEHTQDGGNGGFAMMALMMVCCMAVVLLFLLIPVVGWPIGLTIGAGGFIAMYFAHQRFMGGHGSHH